MLEAAPSRAGKASNGRGDAEASGSAGHRSLAVVVTSDFWYRTEAPTAGRRPTPAAGGELQSKPARPDAATCQRSPSRLPRLPASRAPRDVAGGRRGRPEIIVGRPSGSSWAASGWAISTSVAAQRSSRRPPGPPDGIRPRATACGRAVPSPWRQTQKAEGERREWRTGPGGEAVMAPGGRATRADGGTAKDGGRGRRRKRERAGGARCGAPRDR